MRNYWWKDFDITLHTKQDGDVNDFIDEKAVMSSLGNIFRTLQGSRRMLPAFAMNLYKLLFELIDHQTARDIGNIIVGTIAQWEDRAVLKKVRVIPDDINNKYDIRIEFVVRNMKEEEVYVYQDILRAA